MPSSIEDRLRIELAERSYDIIVGRNLIGRPEAFSALRAGRHAVVVTNATVDPLYGDALVGSLRQRFTNIERVVLADGEEHKDWSTLQHIFDALLGSGADRQTTLFALGGGVIGDMTGFAAACFMRGVPYVQVPTTLLAQVDSSVGGKTAINHPLGKNMIGAFYQPKLVVSDLDTLRTLPDRELIAGLAEVIKYGPIADIAFFEWIEAHLEALLERDPEALAFAVLHSCRLKARVVEQDERESGLRAILNFGHTFGHAIEAGLGYGQWLHGEAVGCGMVMAADLSLRLGLISPASSLRIRSLVEKAGLPVRCPPLGADRYLELMHLDKKAEGGDLRFVVLEALGRARLERVSERLVADVIDAHSR